MSKLDAQRAMREARYARMQARAAGSAAAPEKAAKPAARKPSRAKPEAEQVDKPASGAGTADDGLCGHRAISGKTCTRERGHSAKSHRYS